MLDLFTRYLIVGGMPEAVSNFADNSNLNDVMRIHRDILNQYKLDFTQYETEDKRLLLTSVTNGLALCQNTARCKTLFAITVEKSMQ